MIATLVGGFVLLFVVLIVQLYEEILKEDDDIYQKDYVHMNDGTPVEFNEDEQE